MAIALFRNKGLTAETIEIGGRRYRMNLEACIETKAGTNNSPHRTNRMYECGLVEAAPFERMLTLARTSSMTSSLQDGTYEQRAIRIADESLAVAYELVKMRTGPS